MQKIDVTGLVSVDQQLLFLIPRELFLSNFDPKKIQM